MKLSAQHKMLSALLFLAAVCLVAAKPIEQNIIALSPTFLNKVQPVIKKCEDETKPSPTTFNNLLIGIVENDVSLNFAYCYLTEVGIIAKDGHIVVNKLTNLSKDLVPEVDTAKVYEECNKSSGKDHLETLRLMFNCYKETSPVLFKQ